MAQVFIMLYLPGYYNYTFSSQKLHIIQMGLIKLKSCAQQRKQSSAETAHIMGDIFTNYTVDKGLIFRIYKKLK